MNRKNRRFCWAVVAWLICGLWSHAWGAPALVTAPSVVVAGETFTVRVEGTQSGAQVRWQAGRNAQLDRVDRLKRQAVFKATRVGDAEVMASVASRKLSARIAIVAPGGGTVRRTDQVQAPVAGVAAGWAAGLKPPTTSYDAYAEQVMQRFLKTGQASERDMLYLMGRPQEFNKLIEVWRGRGAEGAQLVEKVLSIRRVVLRRALAAIRRTGEAAETFAVMAMGSWAKELNAGDMDVIVHGGPGAAQELNAALDREVVRIIEQQGDDVFSTAAREGVTITVERLEIFVSTLGDFGYRQLGQALRESISMGDAVGAEHIRRASEEIMRRNLAAQQRAVLNPEVYAGQSGFNFAQDYASRNLTCWVTRPGLLPVQENMTAQQLVERMLRELGLVAEPGTPGVFNFARVATEYAEWAGRAGRGAREQAKGIRRTLDALNPEDAAAILAEAGNNRIARLASILANCKREEVQHIKELLEMLHVTDVEFSAAGERLLWEAVNRSNARVLRQIEANIAQAQAARDAGRAIEAEYRRIMDYLNSQEQLAGYAKLNGEQLMRLSRVLPSDLPMRGECEALLEFMAVGARREADDAAALAIRLIRIAQKQGRLGADAADAAADLAGKLKPLPEEVQGVVAGLRRDLAELASIQAIAPEGTTVEQCIQLMQQYRKSAPGLLGGAEVEELVTWLNRASEMELLRMGFRESEIAVLRQVARARANGLNPAALGNAAKKGSPNHWAATVLYVGVGGGIAVYQMIQAANDPNSSDTAFEEALYGSFPTFGLLAEGLPGALAEADAGDGWSNWSLEQVQGKKLVGDVALAMMEGVGLAFPEVGAVVLVVYMGGAVGLAGAENQEERAFVQALYDALDENGELNTTGGKRSFLLLPPPRIEREPGSNRVRIVHTAAFEAMYGREGQVKLVVRSGSRPYDGVLRDSLRDYAARHFWVGSKKLDTWETAVHRYFPSTSLDLNQVESWNFSEVSEQARTVSGQPFRVGAHLVRRYVHERDLLTEAAIQQLFGRVMAMKQLIAHGDEWRKQLEAIERGLGMEGRIVPKVREEVESLAKVMMDAAFTSGTYSERVTGIWKRYLKTYGEALKFLEGRVAKVFADAGLDTPAGDVFFGLSGAEPEDAPKIQKVYEEFQGAFLGASRDFKSAKGGVPDLKDAFDADAWGRLLSVSLRLLSPSTAARGEKLKVEREAILREIKAHYKWGVIQLAVKGPEPAQPKASETVRFSAEISRTGGDGTPLDVVWFAEDGKTELRRGRVFELPQAKEGPVKLVVAAVTRPKPPAQPARVAEKTVAFKVGPKGAGQDGPATKPDGKPAGKDADGEGGTPSGTTTVDEDDAKKPLFKQGSGGSASGQFPGESFNGMQISYNFSGCSLPEMKDSPGFTTSRSYKGRLGNGTMTLSGSARMGNGYGASLSVSVNAGGQHKEHTSYIKSGWPGFNTDTFNLTIPIPADATSGGFGIRMNGEYNAGSRGLVVSGSCSADGPEGPAPKGTEALSVTLSGPTESVPLGKEVEVTAQAKGGRFPYSHIWTGAVGNGEHAKVKMDRPGGKQVAVTVTDSDGQRAGANLTLKTTPLKLELTGAPNQTYYGSSGPLQVSGPLDFPPTAAPRVGGNSTNTNLLDNCKEEAGCMVVLSPTDDPDEMDKPAPSGKRQVIWQAEPAVTFHPSVSTDGRTQVTYDRMGEVKLWCEIHEQVDGAFQTVGECDQVRVQVVAPKFSVVFTPPEGEGRIGQDIRARVSSLPAVADNLIDYRWFDPTSSNRMEYTNNASEISFKVKDAKPVVLNALARVPHYGDAIGEITGNYTGAAYEVKIGEPRHRGPQLQIWVCDTQLGHAKDCGMKDIPEGNFATFQDIFLQAEVSPSLAALRYRWTVDPSGSCGLPGAGSELRLNCSNTGTYKVGLQVVDADNILLGQAERTVTISVSDQDVKQAPRSKAASEKMQQAKQRFDEDQLDEAIDLAAAAATLDPKNIEAQQLGHRWDGERQTVRQQLDRVKDALQRDNLDEAQKALDAAKQLHPSYPPVRDAERQIADQRKLASTHATATTPYVRIEACVDGSEWIRIENSRLSHQHRTLSQIGEHVDCRLPHRIAGGGFLVDGQVITLGRLPLPIRISNIDHFEVERGRGSVRMVGSKRILINDDAPGADLYIIRLYQGSAAPAAPVAGSPIAPPEATSPVVVTAKADKVTINLGEQTWVRAEATGGTPPYTYQWTGGLTGSWQAVDLQGERAGDTIAMVPVRDSRGRTGSAQVMVEVRADDNQVAKADKINALLSKAHALSASPGESLLTVLL